MSENMRDNNKSQAKDPYLEDKMVMFEDKEGNSKYVFYRKSTFARLTGLSFISGI